MRIYDGVVVVDYGSASLESSSDPDSLQQASFEGHTNSLAGGAEDGVLSIRVASQSGYVKFILDVFDDEPPMPDGYEDIAETRFAPQEPTARLCGFWGESVAEVEMTAPMYQARVASRGTANAWDYPEREEDEDQTRPDEYLIQLWPSDDPVERVVVASPPAQLVPLQHLDPDEPRIRRALRQADPRMRHEALIWLVELLGSTFGIDGDPRFVRVIADSREILEEHMANGEPHVEFLDAMYDDPLTSSAYERIEPALSEASDRWTTAAELGVDTTDVVNVWRAWTAASNLVFAPSEGPDYAPAGGPQIIEYAEQAVGPRWNDVESEMIHRLELPA
jgi:hypothetical protein